MRFTLRNLRQSVIVTGKTLVCELLTNFPCRRLAVRRRSLAALQATLPSLHRFVDTSIKRHNSASTDDNELPPSNLHDPSSIKAHPRLNANVETHFVSNRILRKVRQLSMLGIANAFLVAYSVNKPSNFCSIFFQVAGFHSYDDGCVAEMRMPEPAENWGNIRLLLCLGNIPSSLGSIRRDQTPTASSVNSDFLDPGTVGTLLRTAAALQWQGAWILPSCPDIFNPLAIRASQV